eukprot:6205228-Pleurochrysis_carterae.AAC.1
MQDSLELARAAKPQSLPNSSESMQSHSAFGRWPALGRPSLYHVVRVPAEHSGVPFERFVSALVEAARHEDECVAAANLRVEIDSSPGERAAQ